jgi:ATP-dependent helicase/nuclease subunit A
MEKSILKLEASAGSGKTYRLALEYIGRLLQMFVELDKKPENFKARQKALGSILAITFTVKAAQEMKSRIIEKLKSFALSPTGRPMSAVDHEFLEELSRATGLNEKKIITISGQLIETILASYDDFNVKTIDSLMSAMIKVIAPDLELPAAYEIAIDARNELAMRAKALLADLADNQWPRLEKTLREFKRLNSYNGWKPDEALSQKIIDLFHLNLRQGIMIEDIAEEEREGNLNSHQDDFRTNLKNLLLILTEEPKDEYKNINVKGNIVKETLLEGMGDFLQTGTDLFKLEKLIVKPFFHKAAANELLKKNTPPAYGEKLSAAYEQLRPCLPKLAMDLSIFKTLPYREFFPDFVKAWSAGKETLFVEEFSQTLAERFAVWQADAFPYLYLKMSDRFSHFLFDEFQDTSTLQFKALAPLIDEVLSGREKASLFIVGDRKQAIYRWRGGNSELMDESALKAEIPAIANLAPGGFSTTLDKNWRSRKEIVEFNNSFWAADMISQIATEPDLQQAIAVNFLNSRQNCPADRETAGGYVEFSLLDEQDEAAGDEEHDSESAGESNDAMSGLQLREICKIIAKLEDHGYEYSDIAILVRKNDQIRAIINHLSRNGIGSVSDQSLLLNANPRVNEIIALMKFLDYPPDNLNFHAFISGAIFRVAALENFSGQMEGFLDDVFINCQGPFYKLFQERYPDCWFGLIAPFFKTVGFLPPYDIFSDICQVFRVYENFPGDTPFFMSLGDVLHRSEHKEGNSIAGFLDTWEKMLENEEAPTVAIPENSPGIRILTMHQSKGLEFPAVIVPINDSREKNPDPLHRDEGRLFHVNADLAIVQPELKDIYQRENIKSSIDLLNLLYVAFTRAKEALFVPVAVKKLSAGPATDKNGLIKRITKTSDIVSRHPKLTWSDNKQPQPTTFGKLEIKTARQSPEKNLIACAAIPSKKVLTRSWQKEYLVFDPAPIGEHLDRKSTERGDRVHDLLARLGDCSSREQVAARVRELAENEQWLESDIDVVSSYLCRDDVFRLLCRGQEVHCEKEVVDNSGAIATFQRLDRLQVGLEEVLIVDFKTGQEIAVDHETQMEKYLSAITPLFPGKNCRGFLLYIDRGEVKEIKCSN